MHPDLTIKAVELVVGHTYPIYAQIVNILERNGDLITKVELGFGDITDRTIHAHVVIQDPAKSKTLLKRSFEPGIFVGTVLSIKDNLTVVDVSCIIFGKSQTTNEMQ